MKTTTQEASFDVAISGLGPTGLTLAHQLGLRGLSVLVLEREPEFYGNARAVYTDGECMRIFQSIGMADELSADMLQSATVQLVMPDGKVFWQLKTHDRQYGWPRSHFFYQPKLETSLANGLRKYAQVQVRRGCEVTRFEQDERGVNVFHVPSRGTGYGKPVANADARSAPAAAEECVSARYFVACDGGRSQARAQLGISMVGKSFPNPWLVVDVKQKTLGDGLHHMPYFNFICDPKLPTVSCVQPDGHHRFEFMLMPGQTREYLEDPATARKLLSRHLDVDKFEILRRLVYTFNALMAERWRDRRVLLAGDAAHMTPQFIGQGMNAGVRDAYNLAWKLEAVIKGRAGDALLDTYEQERKPHAAAMIREGVRMKSVVSMTNPLGVVARNALVRLAQGLPVVGSFIREGNFIPSASYRPGGYFGMPRSGWRGAEGRLLPQPQVLGANGRVGKLDHQLGSGYVLLGAGVDPRQYLGPQERAIWSRLDARFVVIYPWGQRPQGEIDRQQPADLIELEDVDETYFNWLKRVGSGAGTIAILRPDKFVFGMPRAKALAEATRSIARQLDLDSAAPQAVSTRPTQAYAEAA